MTTKQSLYLAACRRQDPSASYSMNGETLIVRWRSAATKKGHVILSRIAADGSAV